MDCTTLHVLAFIFGWFGGLMCGSDSSVVVIECNGNADRNITVGVLMELSPWSDFPFSINRTLGLVRMAFNRTCGILNGVVNMKMVVMPVDVPTCVEYKWGSMFAEMYYEHAQHAVMGPCEFQDHIVLRIERLQQLGEGHIPNGRVFDDPPFYVCRL